ncbi:MAG: GNAT family N-acetyltransferase [Bacteroides sp.]|nr:GNAT family N-acetyltransferase [Bacteroides sp.]
MSTTLNIRKTTPEEVGTLLELFEEARHIMRADGNLQQWTGGYPSEELIRKEIEAGNSYVCTDKAGNVVGTFAFIVGEDPTYRIIYEGEWLENVSTYGTIHRLAGKGDGHGVAAACINWCYQQVPNLRADTHRDNRILQHILTKHGFHYCGIIHLLNGDERLAYQKI